MTEQMTDAEVVTMIAEIENARYDMYGNEIKVGLWAFEPRTKFMGDTGLVFSENKTTNNPMQVDIVGDYQAELSDPDSELIWGEVSHCYLIIIGENRPTENELDELQNKFDLEQGYDKLEEVSEEHFKNR